MNCVEVFAYQITEHTVHLLPTKLQKRMTHLGPNITGLVTDVQVNVYIGNILSWPVTYSGVTGNSIE